MGNSSSNSRSQEKSELNKQIYLANDRDANNPSSQLRVAAYYIAVLQHSILSKDEVNANDAGAKARSNLGKVYENDKNNLLAYVLYAELNIIQKKYSQAEGWLNNIKLHAHKNNPIPLLDSFDHLGAPYQKKYGFDSFNALAESELNRIEELTSQDQASIGHSPKGTGTLSLWDRITSSRRNSTAASAATSNRLTFN